VPSGPGLGVTMDTGALKKFTLAELQLDAE